MGIKNEGYLTRLVELGGKQAWIGDRPPFDMEEIDLINSTNFRANPSFHQQYKVAWFYEYLLSDIKYTKWKIALDEMIRLIGEEGYIVLRTLQNSQLTIPLIKNFIGRKFNVRCYIEYEEVEKETGIWTLVFKIKRYNLHKYKDKLWTLGILTSGNKNKNVIAFLQSVRKQDKNNDYEIIISGPRSEEYDKYNVKYLDMSSFRDDQYAEISRKKNAIIDMASNENLLIVHDRYILEDRFFIGFEQYGYDFDFVTVKQFYENGAVYPSYCAIERSLIWDKPIRVDNYSELFDTQYLNGGLLIFKKHVIEQIRFNDLIMWNQMEDVELAKELLNVGVIPRVNFVSSAITIGITEDYTKEFRVYSSSNKQECDPFGIHSAIRIEMGIGASPYTRFTKFIPQGFKNNKIYQNLKRYMLSR